jgi:hypothetical protein
MTTTSGDVRRESSRFRTLAGKPRRGVPANSPPALVRLCIQWGMRRPACNYLFLLVVLLFSSLLLAQTTGSFRGTIVDGTHSAAGKTWIYVQSHNGMARWVDISHATVSYDANISAHPGGRSPQEELLIASC